MPRQERIQRLLFELLEAVSDGKVEASEATGLLRKLAGLIPARKIVKGGVGLLIDALHRTPDEMRAAAARKLERVKALSEELEDELEDEGENKRTRRLEKKIANLREDAEDLVGRASEKEA